MLFSRPVDVLGGPRQQLGPTPFPLNRIPATSDINYPIGQIVVYEAGNTFYGLSSKSGGLAHWVNMGSTLAGGIQTLTGGTGGPISPVLGNVNLAGTTNQITTTGSGNTITFSIPSVFIAPGSIAATTTLTATLGNITATNGNLVLVAAGNKINRTSVATTTTAGANSAGTVTLVGGTATVATTAVTAGSLIRISRMGIGATGAAALGQLSTGTISTGVSFVINAVQAADATALQASDVSSIYWELTN